VIDTGDGIDDIRDNIKCESAGDPKFVWWYFIDCHTWMFVVCSAQLHPLYLAAELLHDCPHA
jgi:hypothetical protein